MQVTIGSNRLRATDGTISIRGRRQIAFEWGRNKHELLLTMDLFGDDGRPVARLRRNQWTFNEGRRFYFTLKNAQFNLTDATTESVVLAGRVVGPDAVVITEGTFHSAGGDAIEIVTEDWNGAADSIAVLEGSRPTIPPFSVDEVASIRRAVALSTGESLECPRCRQPLTAVRIARLDSLLLSCTECRGTLVMRRSA